MISVRAQAQTKGAIVKAVKPTYSSNNNWWRYVNTDGSLNYNYPYNSNYGLRPDLSSFNGFCPGVAES